MLPPRITRVRTREVSDLAAVQAERGREYVRLVGGAFEGELDEHSDGAVALLRECWSAPLRVCCARSRDYVAFSAVLASADARWCGVPLDRTSLLDVGRDWELSTRGAVESFSFAVPREALDRVETLLGGAERASSPGENKVAFGPAVEPLAHELRLRVETALAVGALATEAACTLRDEFLYLAARLHRGTQGGAQLPESFSRRRRLVRTVEGYLDAHPRKALSMAALCELTGASERTVEYAFREQLGLSPNRYLRLRRLHGARRDLLNADPDEVDVTGVAMSWDFWHLGRFAADYEQSFGERPSATLARRRVCASRR